MRHVCGLALVAASISLSGCVNSSFDSLSSLQTGCNANNNSVACTSPTPIITPPPKSPTGQPIVNTGNTAGLATGDTTIAVESSINTTGIGASALSKLIDSPLNRTLANGNMTADQQIWFNTGTATNGYWPVSKTMNYNDYGSCVVESTTPGVMTSTNTVDTTVVNGVAVNAGKCLNGTGGKGLGGNYKLYRFYDPATYDEELQVWSWNQSYATQYRDVTASGNDPQHQAWSFGGNYTTAANMPTSGQVNYVGQWTATAKTAGFLKNPVGIQVPILDGNGVWTGALGQIIQKVQPSNDWRVSGNSALTADFGAGTLTGRLHSNNWQGLDLVNNHYNVDPNAAAAATADCIKLINSCSPLTLSGQATLQNWLNYNATFMSTEVVLKGAIKTYPPKPTNPPTPPAATTTNKENQVVGTAAMDPNNGWLTINGLNPMYAGFFGTVTAGKPQEVTGAFALKSTVTLPNGGTGINNDQRATIEMSGIFNGQ